MVKIAKVTDYKKLKELKTKIHDKEYLEEAITQIAFTLTAEMIEAEFHMNKSIFFDEEGKE